MPECVSKGRQKEETKRKDEPTEEGRITSLHSRVLVRPDGTNPLTTEEHILGQSEIRKLYSNATGR